MARFVRFVPVHFNTDYIYRLNELPDPDTNHLGVPSEKIRRKRDKAFRSIGRFFGIYTLQFGLKAYNDNELQVPQRSVRSPSLERIVKSLRPMLDTGLGQEALFTLTSTYKDGHIARSSLLAFAMVAQKSGLAEAFHRACEELLRPQVFSILPVEEKARLSILRLKFFTQVGDYLAAKSIIRTCETENTDFTSINQFGAYQRRRAVVFAAAGDRGRIFRLS